MNTPTPRTDEMIDDARNVAMEFTCKNPPPKEGENVYVVPADFARQLEQELNEAKEIIEGLRSDKDEIYKAAIAENERCILIADERDQLKKVLDVFETYHVFETKTI